MPLAKMEQGKASGHAGKMFDRSREVFNGLFRITMFDALADTVIQMSFQNQLSHLMQSGFDGIDLDQNIRTGNILIDHLIDGVELSLYLIQSSV